MELQPVKSSNLAAVGYNEDCHLLRVRFLDGSVYDYPDVAPEWYAEFMAATRKGFMMRELARRGFRLGSRGVAPAETAAGFPGGGSAAELNFDKEVLRAQDKPAPDCHFSMSWK